MEKRRKACEAKGYFWNEDEQKCSKPVITVVKLTLTRGSICGNRRIKTRYVRKPLPPKLYKALVMAAKGT